MKNKTLLLLSILLVSATISFGQGAIATLASLQGQVSVKTASGDSWERAENNTALNAGDLVRTAENSSVTILYANGDEARLGPNQTYTVGARQTQASLPQRILAAIQALFEPQAELTQGVRRGLDEPPVMLYPRRGKVFSRTPSFAWLASEPGTIYCLKIVKDKSSICHILGDDLWEKTTCDTVMTFPKAEQALIEGQNYWVDIKRETSGYFEDYGCFSVATADQRAELDTLRQNLVTRYGSNDPNDVTFAVVYAALLINEEFYSDALVIVQGALRKQPKNPTLRSLQNRIYAETELF